MSEHEHTEPEPDERADEAVELHEQEDGDEREDDEPLVESG
jgi:hypothetical protein